MADFPNVDNRSWTAAYPRSFEVAFMTGMSQSELPAPYSFNHMTTESTFAHDYNVTMGHGAYDMAEDLSQLDLLNMQQGDYGNTYTQPLTTNAIWPARPLTYFDDAGYPPAEPGAVPDATNPNVGETIGSDDSDSEWSDSDIDTPTVRSTIFRSSPVTPSYLAYHRCHCDRPFVRPEHLRRHMKTVHGTERAHQCKICERRFSRGDNLRDHYWTHVQREAARKGRNNKYSIDELKAILGKSEKKLLRKLRAKLAYNLSKPKRR